MQENSELPWTIDPVNKVVLLSPSFVDDGGVMSSGVSIGGGAVMSMGVVVSTSGGVVKMVSGGHVALLPLNVNSARCDQVEPE